MFSFVNSSELRERIELEFYAARYIYKLGEALLVAEERLHAHVKFQIVQYASIYEAIVVYLLWEYYEHENAVIDIEFHSAFRKIATLPTNIQLLTVHNEEVVLCTAGKQKTPKASIKFDDKVDAAVTIGFIEKDLGEEIKGFYKLRNAIHLESAVKNQISYELEQSQLAYRRMLPFTRSIKGFLKDGKIPENAKLKTKGARKRSTKKAD